MMKRVLPFAAAFILLTGCAAHTEPDTAGYQITGQMPLEYAEQFSVDHCTDGCFVIHIAAESYLFVPDGCSEPEGNSLPVIRQPHGDIYLASSSAMDLFDAIGSLDAVTMTSTDIGGWTLPAVQDAMQRGELTFIGKYSAPDYEALTESDCPLAIENTMISHSPAVKEQIESLGIPVIVERSSYEQHPLGRMEWMKLYGLLLGKEEEAEKVFEEKTAGFHALQLPDISDAERKTVAFFSVTANGAVNIRKPGDYISQMIGLAGGRYIFTADDLHIDDNALSTMNIQMETFYSIAKNADILIYNSTIEGQLDSIAQLIEKSSVFKDFRAVQDDAVWCTEQNFYQQTTGAADMMTDLNYIFSGQAENIEQLTYLHRIH
ncbi:MAG: ABC transporter substrate-binding protein [Oscillospiraceae bacterium]|nr:ABC transporter substrate-binding protein [Oscillospiraceae bacterium]